MLAQGVRLQCLGLPIFRAFLLLLVLNQNDFAELKFGLVDMALGVDSPPVPALVILGDSTVDVGVNNYLTTLVKCDWPPYGRDFPTGKPTGRFCDGKLSIDFIADRLGLPYPLPFLDPNAHGNAILTGINVASSGSGYLDLTAFQLGVISLPQQVSWIKEWQSEVTALVGTDTADKIFQQGIYVLSTGSNDWLNNYYLNLNLQLFTTKTKYRNELLGLARQRLQDLYDLGARKVVVLSLPPMGCVPFQIAAYNGHDKCIDFMNNDSLAFNSGLAKVVDQLKSLDGSKFVYLDSYNLTYDAFQNPTKYGIANSNTSHSCCENWAIPSVGPFCNKFSTACTNANEYLFWDGFHPTEFYNHQMADYFYLAVKDALGLPP